jgi:hypothetical protein
MGRPKEYICKTCNNGVDLMGPGTLGRHYKQFPTHKPTYQKGGHAKQERNPTMHIEKKGKPSQGESNTALDLFIDNPESILELINAKILQQREVINVARLDAELATQKIKRLEEFQRLLSHQDEPREVLASHGEVFHPTSFQVSK